MEIHALHFPFGIQSLNYILARKRAFVDKKDAASKENIEMIIICQGKQLRRYRRERVSVQ